MPLSAPTGPRGSKPPEENPPRIILVRPAEISRRGTLVRQDNCVSIDIEDDPDSVALSSQSQDPSGIEVVVDSLGEPHPSSSLSRADTDPGPAEGALQDGRKNLQSGRKAKSAEAVLSQAPFQAKSSPAVPETNIVPFHEFESGESGESISISSGIANEIRESEENEVQPAEPGPSCAHNSISISFSDDDIGDLGEEISGNETPENETDSSSSNSLPPHHEDEANPSLNARNAQLSARMKRLLFGVVSKRPAQPEEIELHEIPSDQNFNLPEISTDFQPESNNAFALSDSYKNLFTTARDLASATSNISVQTQNERRGNGSSDPGGEDGDSSGAESPTGRNRPRNSRMRGLVRMQMAARGMREDARRNAFVGTLSVFETMIQFGYYLGVIPFRVTFDGTKYVIKTSIPRQIAVFVMLLVVIWCEARKSLEHVEAVDIKDYPGSLFTATEEVVRVWLLIAYGFVLYWKQGKFLVAFEEFTHDFQRPRSNQPNVMKKVRAKHVALAFCFIYLVIANWMAWIKIFFLRATFFDFLDSFYFKGIDTLKFPDIPNNQVYYWVVSLFFWTIKTYSFVLKYYMEGMLWASAWTLYSIEQKTRSYTLKDGAFEINMGTETFRSVIKLVRNLNRTLGPLRVVQFLVLIPYLVNIAYNAGNGQFDLLQVFQIPLQVGHFALAAEASANMKNLIQHIVLFKINLSPEQRQNPTAWNQLSIRQNFFSMIASTPIALEGMDFFEVSYVVLGNIAASVITYVLVILDWKRELPTPTPLIDNETITNAFL